MQQVEITDFWKWAYSDLLSNALRGVLAEYIVACAADCRHRSRVEWAAYDLETDAGLRIEVKSSAYLQSWEQAKHSRISFDIAEKREDNTVNKDSARLARRSADVYVFCVFTTTERKEADPSKLNQWFFLVCPTETLNARFGQQKTVTLAALEALGLTRIDFDGLGSELARQIALKADAQA